MTYFAYQDKCWCGRCGEWKLKQDRCPDCGQMVRLWTRPSRRK